MAAPKDAMAECTRTASSEVEDEKEDGIIVMAKPARPSSIR